MKAILCLLVAVMGSASFAQTVDPDVAKAQAALAKSQSSVAALNASLAKLQASHAEGLKALDATKADYRRADEIYQKANQAYEAAKSAHKESAGGLSVGGFDFFGGSGDPKLKASLDNAKAALDTATATRNAAMAKIGEVENGVRQLGQQYRSTSSEMAGVQSDIASTQKELAKYNQTAQRALLQMIESQGLSGQFSKVEAQAGRLEAAMAALEARYDKSVLGAYLREKMKDMLNDKDTFCAAKNQCDGKGGPVSDKAVSNLFKGGATAVAKPASTPASAASGATK